MAGDRSDIKVRFLGDDSQLSRVMGRVEKVSDRAHGRFSKAGAAIGKAGLVASGGLAAVAAGAIAAGPALLDTAIQAEAMQNKAATVFGSKGLGKIDAWADKVAAKMGVTNTQAKGLAAGLGDLLIPMGFSQDKAAKLATGYADMAGAMSQWSNGKLSAQDATDMLSDAMMGEFDSLKAVGVQMDQDSLKKLMAAKGYDKLTGAAQKQKQAEVVLGEIRRQSGSALESYEKNTNKLAIAKNKLAAKISTVKEKLATALIPAMSKGMDMASKGLGPAFAYLSDKVFPVLAKFLEKDVGPAFRVVAEFVQRNVVPVLAMLGRIIVGSVFPAVMKIAGAIMGGLKSAFSQINASIERNRPGLEKLGVVFAALAKFVYGTLAPVIGAVLGTAFKLIGWILGNVLIPAVGKLGDIFTWLWNKVVAPVTRFMLNAFAGVAQFYAGMLRGLSKVPGFGWAKGAADKLDAAAGKARALASGVKQIPNKKNINIQIGVTGTAITGRIKLPDGTTVNLGQRAKGGPVSKGSPYIVGEKGPELVFPDSDGEVVDAATTRALMRGGSSGGGRSLAGGGGGGGGVVQHIVIHVTGALDPLGTARQIRELLSQLSRTEGVPITFGGTA